MSPVAKDDAMLRMLESDHDLTWILAASGWPRRQVEAFAAKNGYRFNPTGRAVKVTRDEDLSGLPVVAGKADARIFRVAVNQLKPNPANPRERFTGIDELAQSMRSVGLIQPIVVRRDTTHVAAFIIVAGHRRHAAAQQLGWQHVDVILRDVTADDDDLLTALIENGQRAGLDPIEEARALNILKNRHKLTDKQIATKVGMSQPVVSGRLALLALSIEEQDEIRRGSMNLSDGVRTARVLSGTARRTGTTGHPHLSSAHDLAGRVRIRCERLAHKKRGRNSVGGVGCGQCWEEIIRADERQRMHSAGGATGTCPVCSGPYGSEEATG